MRTESRVGRGGRGDAVGAVRVGEGGRGAPLTAALASAFCALLERLDAPSGFAADADHAGRERARCALVPAGHASGHDVRFRSAHDSGARHALAPGVERRARETIDGADNDDLEVVGVPLAAPAEWCLDWCVQLSRALHAVCVCVCLCVHRSRAG